MKWPLVWRSTFDRVESHRNQVMATNERLHAENVRQQEINNKLRGDLFQAQKNDMPRDPKTGRWTKRGTA